MPNTLFSLRDLTYELTCAALVIHAVTDTPCHLYLRWTAVPPQYHSKTALLRGLALHDDVYFCFVAYDDIEQDEAGDTLTHTFTLPAWPPCETRWFYFWATIGGVPSISTTPPFEYHRPDCSIPPDLYLIINESWTICPLPDYSILVILETW